MDDDSEHSPRRASPLRRALYWSALVLAVAFLALTIYNASWLAPQPHGSAKLIAHRGVNQYFDRSGLGPDDCTATRIEQPIHNYLENTDRSIDHAQRLGAQMVEVDISPTSDGRIALFHDWTLECRTDGKGAVREKTLAELKALDPGYGYSADGGKTFPLRGRGQRIPSLEQGLAASPRLPLVFNFKSRNPSEADLLVKALKAAGRDPAASKDVFYGDAAPVERLRQLSPASWAFTADEAARCSTDYIKTGWTGSVPQSCIGGTMVIPVNYQFLFWGWPNRLIERLEASGTRIIVTGPYKSGEMNTGLYLPEQLGQVPRGFNGYIWVEDIWTLGPALHPSLDKRSYDEQVAAEAALERRRAAE